MQQNETGAQDPRDDTHQSRRMIAAAAGNVPVDIDLGSEPDSHDSMPLLGVSSAEEGPVRPANSNNNHWNDSASDPDTEQAADNLLAYGRRSGANHHGTQGAQAQAPQPVAPAMASLSACEVDLLNYLNATPSFSSTTYTTLRIPQRGRGDANYAAEMADYQAGLFARHMEELLHLNPTLMVMENVATFRGDAGAGPEEGDPNDDVEDLASDSDSTAAQPLTVAPLTVAESGTSAPAAPLLEEVN